ncbi:hypothetical protein GTZ99_03230 [Novosphingobium sp. FSY-8]|uniref:DNA polymerase n=1 Tax=Novosphingobium ovatum TaxID=1908523 RepID=A0ABW9XAN7_9SPHN|nr:uracil-DNA glycosylase family protein [Novosphingobium ovatum]NBC35565.1 hypothetical protein [Novosphingobium ovatum]
MTMNAPPASPFDQPANAPAGAMIAAALDWWRLAGVDLDYTEEPAPWLIEATADEGEPLPGAGPVPEVNAAYLASAPDPAQAASDGAIGGERGQWPQTLETFAPWWLNEPSLDDGHTEGRVPPRGEAGADVLILLPYPEAQDAAAGRLGAGPQGQMVAAMLAAGGVEPNRVYWASALPRHTPHPDWAALESAGLGGVLLHHLTLAAPKRVVVMGRMLLPLVNPSLTGHNPAQSSAFLRLVNATGSDKGNEGLPLLAAHAPSMVLQRPRAKAMLWRQWLDFTANSTT